jgi:hypothetical protein
LDKALPASIARKLEFHYTPKCGSWLNMAEMECFVLSRTCLAGGVPDEATLQRRINANVAERTASPSLPTGASPSAMFAASFIGFTHQRQHDY